MLCCLTIDPVVARPTGDGRCPVQFRSLCLFNPTGGTRQSFTIPFQYDPPSHEVALQPPVESEPASPTVSAMLSWRTYIRRPHLIGVSDLQMTQQIRIDLVLGCRLTGPSLGNDGPETHLLHQTLDPFVIDRIPQSLDIDRHFRPAKIRRFRVLSVD